MIEITDKPINPSNVFERLSHKNSGSVVFHFGVVKEAVEGKRTKGIRFAPKGDLEGELKALEALLRNNWKVEDILIIRRMGELRIGDIILVAAVSAQSREDAFGACRDAVEGCKKIKNISKKELFEGE